MRHEYPATEKDKDPAGTGGSRCKNIWNRAKVLKWLAIYLVVYMVCFFLLKKRYVAAYHHPVMEIDRHIPFVKYFVLPYIFWFLWVPFICIYTALTDPTQYRKISVMMMTGMTAYLVISAIYPTELSLRPDTLQARDIFCSLTAFIYGLSPETYVFPSLHVFLSCIAFYTVLTGKNQLFLKKRFRGFSLAVTILICLSAILLRQHSLIDAAGGIIMFFLIEAGAKFRRVTSSARAPEDHIGKC